MSSGSSRVLVRLLFICGQVLCRGPAPVIYTIWAVSLRGPGFGLGKAASLTLRLFCLHGRC